jgi:VWFA-related protein
VIVDVVVRDSNNKAVRGLKPSDFVVAEDGHLQTVLSFDVHDFDSSSISLPSNAPHLPNNSFANIPATPEHGPLYVILYDLANMEVDDQIDARRQVLKFIDSKPPGTRFAIFVRSDGLYLVQGFTDDKDRLYAALDPRNPKAHVPRVFLLARNYGYRDPAQMLGVFNHVSEFLDGIPGRKNLIWIAGTFPLAFFPKAGDPHDYREDIKVEVNALTQSQIAIYPVSVRGVVPNPEGASTGAGPHTGVGGESYSPPPGAPPTSATGSSPTPPPQSASPVENPDTSLYSSLAADYAVQKELAKSTGGRAFFSTNDLAAALTEVTEIDGNYYSLTYAPTNQKDDGTLRNIEVKIAQRGYQLSYRRSYFALARGSRSSSEAAQTTTASSSPTSVQTDTLQVNMKHGAPMIHDLLFSAHVRTDGAPTRATADQMSQLATEAAYFRTHHNDKPVKPLAPVELQKYVIDYRVTDLALKSRVTQDGNVPSFEFAAAAFDLDGRMLNGVVNNAAGQASASEGPNESGVFRVRQQLDVPTNAAWIRIGVRNQLTGRTGCLEIQLPLAPPSPSTTLAH